MIRILKFIGVVVGIVLTWLLTEFLAIQILGLGQGLPLGMNQDLIQYSQSYFHYKLAIQWIITLIILYFFFRFRNQKLDQVDRPYLWNNRFSIDSWKMIIIGWGTAFLGMIITGVIINSLAGNPITISNLQPVGVFEGQNIFDVVVLIGIMSIIVPIGEEMFFRGVLFREINLLFSFIPSLILASIVFAIVHLNLAQTANTFFLGMVLCFIYFKRRNIKDVILLHMVNNFFAYFINISQTTYYITMVGGFICFIIGIKFLIDMNKDK